MKFTYFGALLLASGVLPGATTDDLFNDAVLHDVRLTLAPTDWQTLKDNYLTDDLYKASFQWGDLKLDNIAIRSRGLGSRNPLKPGLKVDFNEYVSQDFLGLKSLVLDNLVQDAAMMSERLSLALFRRAGIPAPRLAHARLYVNDNYVGLYTIVEPVDKAFLRRVYNNDKGDLYDYEWAFEYRFENLGPDRAAYFPVPFEPKTNESSFDGASLIEMIRIANEASDIDFPAEIANYIDAKAFVKYLAAEAFVGDIDGFLGDWGINNFYLYRLPGATRFTLIAWDKDVTFRDPQRDIWAGVQQNVLARRLLAIPENRDAYLAALEEMALAAEGPGGWLEQQLDLTYAQINVAVLEDALTPYPYSEFDLNVALVRHYIQSRPASLLQQIEAARQPAAELATIGE
ncbi:MAG: CotH kinase family protein [Bryobacterales bacterium]|nr:CotH kinase family protein [Bryobacterales bacterium]